MVGPRLLLPEYLKPYSKEQERRYEVKPGITGWAQVNKRNAITWEEKFQLDIWYVEHQSFLLDLKIIFKTFKKVFVSEGINIEGQATTLSFAGTKNSKS
jgi:lipopolysaccharide/colanic/teichoic acid biosynthesis glycosyltransferase